MAALAVLAVAFTVAGVHHNSQIDRLRTQGVVVSVTVTGCQGQLGGSGSNVAGYSCRGTFTLDGRSHTVTVDAGTLENVAYTATAPGSTLTVQLFGSATQYENLTSFGAISVSNMTLSLPTVAAGAAAPEVV